MRLCFCPSSTQTSYRLEILDIKVLKRYSAILAAIIKGADQTAGMCG